jgi:PAS domain S-box-containing protein
MLVVMMGFYWSYREHNKADENERLMVEIQKAIFERTSLRDEYLQYREERAKFEWQKKTEYAEKVMGLVSERFKDDMSKAILNEMRRNYESTVAIFLRIVENRERKDLNEKEKALSREYENRLYSQILLKSHALSETTQRLLESSRRKSGSALKLANILLFIFVVALMISILTNSILLNRILRNRLGTIHEGTKIIGSGNLDYRIDLRSKDEFEDLSNEFNAMSDKLKKSFVSIENLEKEITGRKRAVERLADSGERYRTLFEGAAEGILVTDIEGQQFKYANPAICRMLGYTIEELTRLGVVDIHPKEALDHVAADFETQARGEMILSPDIPCLRKDGSIIYTSIATAPVVIDGRKCNVGFFTDITERKRAEEALRESEKRFKLAAESSTDLIYEWDIKERIDWFGKIDELLGYSPSEFPRTFEAWANSVHPEDRDRVVAAVKNHLEKNEPYNIEYRVRKKDGTYNYWWVRGNTVRDEKGNPYRWVGAITDVTGRKRAEEALRESEEQYRTVLDNIEYGYFEVDIAGNFTFFNDSLCRILGYSRDETMGMNNRQYMDKENTQKVYQAFNRAYTTGEPYRSFDWEILRKDGTKRFVESSVSLLRDLKGEGIGFRGIVRDITERKLAEAEREKLIHEIQDALAQIKKLSGLLPICASCKKIRDDKGYWNQIESYIRDHSEAEFSHGICPECMKKLYGDFLKEEDISRKQ